MLPHPCDGRHRRGAGTRSRLLIHPIVTRLRVSATPRSPGSRPRRSPRSSPPRCARRRRHRSVADLRVRYQEEAAHDLGHVEILARVAHADALLGLVAAGAHVGGDRSRLRGAGRNQVIGVRAGRDLAVVDQPQVGVPLGGQQRVGLGGVDSGRGTGARPRGRRARARAARAVRRSARAAARARLSPRSARGSSGPRSAGARRSGRSARRRSRCPSRPRRCRRSARAAARPPSPGRAGART